MYFFLSNPQSPVCGNSSVWQLREFPSPLALDTRSSGTAFVHCHVNIPAWKQSLLSLSTFQMHIWCHSSSAAFRTHKPQVFSSCISDTRRKCCCCQYNGKKQMMITKARAQGILSGSRLGWRKKKIKLLQPFKNGNSTSGLINISFPFIEHLAFWGSVVFIN